MELTTLFKSVLNLSLSQSNGGLTSPRWSESASIEFNVKHRYVENVVTLNASTSLNINVASLGLSSSNFIYVSALEPNRSLNLKFNGDTTGLNLNPPDVSKRVYFCAVSNFTSLEITNLSTTDPVTVVYLLVEKA